MRRVMSIPLQADCLMDLLKQLDGEARLRINNLPADARAVGIAQDPVHFNQVTLFVESSEFPETYQGEVPQRLVLEVERL